MSYIHSKFLLKDPLGSDPIVVTGSANFSDASTNDNDENMLVIRGNQRVADIYFTEFNRLFYHYYFRSVQERTRKMLSAAEKKKQDQKSLFLDETDGWLAAYKPGSLKQKRVDMFKRMKGFAEPWKGPELQGCPADRRYEAQPADRRCGRTRRWHERCARRRARCSNWRRPCRPPTLWTSTCASTQSPTLAAAGEVGRDAGRRQHRTRLDARRRAIAERDVAQRHQQAAVRAAAAVGMVRQDADADDERPVRLLAHEERAEMIEERAGSKQRLEAGRRRVVGHGA